MWPFRTKRYTTDLRTSGFLSAVELTKGHDGDATHEIKLRFGEPVGDGNGIAYFNVLQDGQAIHQDRLFTGETRYRTGFYPAVGEYQFLFLDTDGTVVARDVVAISKE